MNQSPIFTRLHDLIVWLLRATRKFPREYRFTLSQEIAQQCFALQDALVAAALERKESAAHLAKADIALTNLRRTLAICFDLQLLDNGSYRHVSGMLAEVGRLLGGWRGNIKSG